MREEALRRLAGTICHQGSRYRASAPAVPFLFEVLETTEPAGQSQVIDLIVQLAVSYPENHLPFGFDPAKEFKAAEKLARRVDLEQVRAATPDPDEDFDEGLSALWAKDAYEAVEARLGVFRTLAHNADEAPRRAAVRALAWFPGAAAASTPIVRATVTSAQSPAELANALLCLGILDRYRQDHSDVPALQQLLPADPPAQVRLAAAISLGVILESRLPDEALLVLIEAAEGRLQGEDLSGVAAWHFCGPLGYAAELLARIRPKPTQPLVSVLCRAAATNTTAARALLWLALLSIVFRRPRQVRWIKDPSLRSGVRAEYLDPQKLTVNQLRALRAIRQNPIWEERDSLSDLHMDLCMRFGLPWYREKFQALVAAAEERRG